MSAITYKTVKGGVSERVYLDGRRVGTIHRKDTPGGARFYYIPWNSLSIHELRETFTSSASLKKTLEAT